MQVSYPSLIILFNVNMERSGLVENRVLSVLGSRRPLCFSRGRERGVPGSPLLPTAEVKMAGCEAAVKLVLDLNSALLLKYVLY